jgi:PAS domain S-box-containing protein
MEDELRDSEEKFRVLAEMSPVAILMHQGDNFIYVNRMAEIVLGYSRERLLNMKFWEPIHPDYQERAIAKWKERAGRKSSYIRSEIKVLRGNVEERWVEVTAGLIEYMGKPTDVITINDITERKHAEEALQEAKTQAELYVDLMSHDINNLNQVGMGFLELALETLDLDESGRELISKSLRALQGSTRLIDSVKKIQKVKSGQLRYYPIDLGETLRRVKEDYSHMPGNSVTINYSPVSDCYVTANELLYDVFSNIVCNAIKYSIREPVIDIIIKKAYDGENLYYKVAIEDNGPGIPDELKPRLFKRQLSGDRMVKGSGIGLYLVKTLVNSYHGRVWAEDRVYGDRSKGSRFVVMLPAATKPR